MRKSKRGVLLFSVCLFVVFAVCFFSVFMQMNKEEAIEESFEEVSASSVFVEEKEVLSPSVSVNTDEPHISVDDVLVDEVTTEEGLFLDLSHFTLWESGAYDSETGDKIENARRIRLPDFIESEGLAYCVFLTEGFNLNIYEYTAEMEYVGITELKDEDVYLPDERVKYFGICLNKDVDEKTLSMGQWNRLFNDDFRVVFCTEDFKDFSMSDLGPLIEASTAKDISTEEMRELLLEGKDDELSNVLWNKQIENGLYSLTGKELDNGNLSYFVSFETGDDNNSGLDAKHPKKSIEQFSGFSNVNVLLKCGETFSVSEGMIIGNNCVYAAYGSGPRPVLNFYRDLNVSFKEDTREENLWVADISTLEIFDGSQTKDNCNIGQLLVDGEINLRRCVWSSKEEFNPQTVVENRDDAWAVDWVESKLYLYSEGDPNQKEIKYAPPSTAFSLKGSRNVTIKGLEIRGVGRHAINMTNAEDVKISCCYINHVGGSVLRQAGVRYGNAVQVWNSGLNIEIEHNYLAWIFDTCFTHQGSDEQSMVEHLHINNNIAAHFYWGIEVWGDGYSENGFSDVVYSDNILFDNVDVTNPLTPMHAGPNTRPQGITDAEYVSYRNAYKYHQMSSINVSNSGNGEVSKIEDNIAWNSNRFLLLANNDRDEEYFSPLENNVFYAEVEEEKACLLRFTQDGEKKYCREMEYLDPSNVWSVHLSTEGYEPIVERKRMDELLVSFCK